MLQSFNYQFFLHTFLRICITVITKHLLTSITSDEEPVGVRLNAYSN